MNRKKIAILVASIDREYQNDFVRGVFEAATAADLDVCVFNCQGYMNVDVSTSDVGESAVFDLPIMREFDGVISLRATFAEEASQQKVEQILKELADKPHVSIDVPTENGVSIFFDDAVSVRQLTEHVVTQHGAKRVVYLSGPLRQLVAATRLRACREALEAQGLELRPEDVFEGEWIHGSGRECAEKLIARKEGLPDAVICGNDDMAFGVAETLQEHGYSIPDDVIVTGYDALRESLSRGLTTIRRSIDLAARKAVEVLAAWMNGEKPAEREMILPSFPEIRESCGCERISEQQARRLHSLRNEYRRTEKTMLQVSMFNGSLASVLGENDAREKIDQFATTLGIRQIYLCVDPSLTRDERHTKGEFAYPERMLLLYGRSGEKLEPAGLFETARILPVLDETRENPLALIFCPLYYRERNFGYLAIEPGTAAGSALYSVLMLLNGALMSLYLQTSLRNYARKVQEMSVHDIMTDMLNRRGFMERSPLLLEQAKREGRYFVMLSADMDFMKKINDQYGHLTGDQAIVRMGRAMRKLEARNMVPVHISGDEFLAYGIADSREEAEGIYDAAHEAIRQLNAEEPWITETSASIGVYAAIPQEGDSIDRFLTQADRKMYQEKNFKKSG